MVIFLDIDGVLVSGAGWKMPELMEDGFPVFTIKSIEALSLLITPTSNVILTTSHRNRYSIEKWKEIFHLRGIHLNHLSRLKASGEQSNRKEEILQWFKKNSIPENFVIIDDDKQLHALPSYLKRHLVITDSIIGLTKEDISELKSLITS